MGSPPSVARAYGAALTCAALAGFSYTVFKLVDPGLPPFTSLLVMSVVSTVAFALLRVTTVRDRPLRLARPAVRLLLVQTGLTYFAIWGLWAGVLRLDPAVASFLGRTEGVFGLLAGVVLLGERFLRSEIPGLALAVCGVGLLIVDGLGRAGADLFGEGVGLMLGGAALMGVSEVWSKRAMALVPPLDFALCRAALLTVAFTAAGLATGNLVPPSPADLLFLALTALLAPTGARLLFLWSLRTLDLTKSVTVNLTQPLFAGLLAAVWLGTSPPAVQWAGGLLALVGCGLLVRARRRAGSGPPSASAPSERSEPGAAGLSSRD